jgi:hypothetical protein
MFMEIELPILLPRVWAKGFVTNICRTVYSTKDNNDSISKSQLSGQVHLFYHRSHSPAKKERLPPFDW